MWWAAVVVLCQLNISEGAANQCAQYSSSQVPSEEACEQIMESFIKDAIEHGFSVYDKACVNISEYPLEEVDGTSS
mgnify:CR=1 FL=1|jgi:hypothetical protein